MKKIFLDFVSEYFICAKLKKENESIYIKDKINN